MTRKSWEFFEAKDLSIKSSINFVLMKSLHHMLLSPYGQIKIEDQMQGFFTSQIKISLFQIESMHSQKVELARSLLNKLLAVYDGPNSKKNRIIPAIKHGRMEKKHFKLPYTILLGNNMSVYALLNSTPSSQDAIESKLFAEEKIYKNIWIRSPYSQLLLTTNW